MFFPDSNTDKVRITLHTFDFTRVSLEPMMRHTFVYRRVDNDADARTDFELL